MVEEDLKLPADSVWAQFHSPVLENATVIDFERMNPQDEARQVEIRKVRQSIDEMSVLLAEMQEMYHPPESIPSPVEGSSPSEAYVTAFDQTNSPTGSALGPSALARKPSLAFGMLTDNQRSSNISQVEHLEGPQRKLRIDNSNTRDSMRASVLSAGNTKKATTEPINSKRRSASSAVSSRHQRHCSQADPVPERSPQRAVSQPQALSKNTTHHHNHHYHHHHNHDTTRESRHHSHPKGHALNHVQQNKHPRSTVTSASSVQPITVQPSTRRSSTRTHFTQEKIKEQLNNTNDLSIDSLDLPPSERKLLERFITALSKLSIEIQMDDAKRQEGRRRMNNALRALEGWI